MKLPSKSVIATTLVPFTVTDTPISGSPFSSRTWPVILLSAGFDCKASRGETNDSLAIIDVNGMAKSAITTHERSHVVHWFKNTILFLIVSYKKVEV